MTPTPAQRDALTRIADEFAGLARQIRVLTQPETPAQDAHTPREQPQTRSGGTESGEGGGGALRVFFGGDDERRMWTWECTDGHPAAFGDELTEYKAFAALVQHWKTRHPNDLDIPKGDA